MTLDPSPILEGRSLSSALNSQINIFNWSVVVNIVIKCSPFVPAAQPVDDLE